MSPGDNQEAHLDVMAGHLGVVMTVEVSVNAVLLDQGLQLHKQSASQSDFLWIYHSIYKVY